MWNLGRIPKNQGNFRLNPEVSNVESGDRTKSWGFQSNGGIWSDQSVVPNVELRIPVKWGTDSKDRWGVGWKEIGAQNLEELIHGCWKWQERELRWVCRWRMFLLFLTPLEVFFNLIAAIKSVKKQNQNKFKDLVDFIQWFMNWATSHLTDRKEL